MIGSTHLRGVILSTCLLGACTSTLPGIEEGQTECGNGLLEQGEACDDGNSDSGDGCEASCSITPDWSCQGQPSVCAPLCGNGRLDSAADENCDDGNSESNDGCDVSCRTESGWDCVFPDGFDNPAVCTTTCGDSIVVGDEDCEDRNYDNHDNCPDGPGGTCQWARCGDGLLWNTTGGQEQCDAGSESADCDSDCTWQACGDGVLNQAAGEACDDGDTESNGQGACVADCAAIQICGDGRTDGTELCDDGDTESNGDRSCVADCTTVQVCGDGFTDGNEVCDDGDTESNGEGACVADCSAVQVCGDHRTNGTEACDDGDTMDNDDLSCVADCSTLQVCGDGVLQGSEDCDAISDSPDCDTDCGWFLGQCGNGRVNDAIGEQCDDGGTEGGDGCNGSCRVEPNWQCVDGSSLASVCTCQGVLHPVSGCLANLQGADCGTDCDASYCLSNDCWLVPPTGQSTCHDTTNGNVIPCPGDAGSDGCSDTPFCGQDAQYPDHQREFLLREVDGETEVEDTLTGLVWTQAYTDGLSWDLALEYCEQLDHAGNTDWRLPSYLEAVSIIKFTSSVPSIDTVGFPGEYNVFFWIGDLSATNSSFAWWVRYDLGAAYDSYPRTDLIRARCVRGPSRQLSSPQRYKQSGGPGQEVLADQATGLMWLKRLLNATSWEQALSQCEGSTDNGFSDWRLPDIQEIASLVDTSRHTPGSSLPGIGSYALCSSTTDISEHLVKYINTQDGTINWMSKTAGCNIHCVRGGP